MKRLLLALLLAFIMPTQGHAQHWRTTGGFIYTGALASLPATCNVGQIAFVTDATAGQNIYECAATNTWTQQLNSGAGGASTTLDNLGITSINADLIPQASKNLGSAANKWANAYLTIVNLPNTTSFPVTPGAGDTVVITDDSASGACDSAAGSAVSICRYNGSAWASIGGSGGGLASSDLDTSAKIAAIVTDETGSGAMVFGTSPTLTTPNLGTPSALTLTNATGLPVAGLSNLGANCGTWLITPSSTNLAACLTGETGSGAAVFGTSPTLDAPTVTSKLNFPHVTAFPGTPSAGDTVVVTDDSAQGACDSAAGSATTMCYYNGSSWVAIGDGTAAGGTVSISGTPSADQMSIWTDASTIKGVSMSGDCTLTGLGAITCTKSSGNQIAGLAASPTLYYINYWSNVTGGSEQMTAFGGDGILLLSTSGAPSVLPSSGTGDVARVTSPSFTTPSLGAATATTPAANDNDTSVATTAYVQTELTAYASDTVTLSGKTLTNPATTTLALTDGATINWDTNSGNVATVTLAGNRTMAAPTNLKTGGSYALQITQDATGSRTLTWNSVFKWPGGTAPTLTTTAAAKDVVTCVSFDGTNLSCSSVADVK